MKWLIPILLIGCAAEVAEAPVVRGPRVTEVQRELRVCVEQGSLSENSRVQFSRNVCTQVNAKLTVTRCHVEAVATAKVVRILDPSCALVAVPVNSTIEPGDVIEVVSR
jgi:hypothetical protein